MRPRSGRPKRSAAAPVAACSASAGVSPAPTSSSSSRCTLSPYGTLAGTPGDWFASVPSTIGTPARYSAATESRACR